MQTFTFSLCQIDSAQLLLPETMTQVVEAATRLGFECCSTCVWCVCVFTFFLRAPFLGWLQGKCEGRPQFGVHVEHVVFLGFKEASLLRDGAPVFVVSDCQLSPFGSPLWPVLFPA